MILDSDQFYNSFTVKIFLLVFQVDKFHHLVGFFQLKSIYEVQTKCFISFSTLGTLFALLTRYPPSSLNTDTPMKVILGL